jgi:hypothetical protein
LHIPQATATCSQPHGVVITMLTFLESNVSYRAQIS